MKSQALLFIAFLFLTVLNIAAQQTSKPVMKHGGDQPADVKLSGTVTVPMELNVRKPVVEVKINGKGPFKFFLDTGAGGTVMDQSLATELALEQDGTTTIGDPADPHGITANRNRIKTLEIGGATFSDLIAVSWDRSPLYQPGSPRGVLGMPLFKKLLLTVDYPGNKVVIESGSL